MAEEQKSLREFSLDDAYRQAVGIHGRCLQEGDFRAALEALAEMRNIKVAQQRLLPESHDRQALLRTFTDAEIRGEFERRDLGDVLTVVWTPLPVASSKAPDAAPKRKRGRPRKVRA